MSILVSFTDTHTRLLLVKTGAENIWIVIFWRYSPHLYEVRYKNLVRPVACVP